MLYIYSLQFNFKSMEKELGNVGTEDAITSEVH